MIRNIDQLRELAWMFRASRVLQIANKLGIFTILSEEPLTARELAIRCNSSIEMTEKLLIACCSLGLILHKEGRYRNSKFSNKYLVMNKPFYQGNWIDHTSDLWRYWSNVEQLIGGKRLSEEKGEGHRRFIMAMHDIAMGGEAEELATHLDLRGKRMLYDVGGGPGTYSIILCRHNPLLRAVIFDLPETIPITKKLIENSKMSDRIAVREGDWDRDEFGQENDIVLMSNILHGPGSKAEMKLRKAFRSMADNSLLIIRDFFLNDSKTGPLSAALFNLMVGAYSIGEISDIIKETGFVNIRELQIPHRTHSILLAEKL